MAVIGVARCWHVAVTLILLLALALAAAGCGEAPDTGQPARTELIRTET